MHDLSIDRIQVYAVGPETARYRWASDLPEMFQASTVLRLTTRGGLEGYAGASSFTAHEFDGSVAATLRTMLPSVLGASPLERAAVWRQLSTLTITVPQAPQALSLIDIALWDLAAKHAQLPLHRMLGGARERILSYASTPLLEDAAAYVDYVAEAQSMGFRAVKFHCWCEPDRDLAMARAVNERHGDSGLAFMLDAEQRYTREGALRVARELGEMGYAWLEAPLFDNDLEGYRELRRRAAVPILPSGNWVLDPQLIALAIRMGCWSSVRFDVTMVGGFTPGMRIAALARTHGMSAEIQSWGYTLTQAANLHLMLAIDNCAYFEQAVPWESYEYGALDVIRTDAEGYVAAPPGPGLGVRLDWSAVEDAAFATYEIAER